MEKEFCTYEQSLALKELGCDYTEYKAEELSLVKRPLIQQALRFFRDKYYLYQVIHIKYDGIWSCFIYKNKDGKCAFDGFKTYEEAEQACLDKLIELAKES